MFGFGTHELILIGAVIVLFFGATKIPALGSSISQGLKNFKRGMREVREEEEKAEALKAQKSLSDGSDNGSEQALKQDISIKEG